MAAADGTRTNAETLKSQHHPAPSSAAPREPNFCHEKAQNAQKGSAWFLSFLCFFVAKKEFLAYGRRCRLTAAAPVRIRRCDN
jgi:hypothetical protein